MQKWNCPTSEEWDRYLLDPDLSERTMLEKHLGSCSSCRFYINERKKEFKELQNSWDTSMPGVIYLSISDHESLPGESLKTRLAAQGNGESDRTESITLSSPDQQVLFRAVRDSRSKEIWLYLIAEKPELYKNVLVKPFDTDQEYITDDLGRVNLGKIDWPDTNKLIAELHLPKSKFILKPLEEFDKDQESVELKSVGGDKIKATFTGDGRNRKLRIQLLEISDELSEIPLKIAIRTSSMTKVSEIKTEVSIDNIREQDIMEIFLYQ